MIPQTPDQLQWVLDHNMQIRGGHRVQISDAVEAWREDRRQLGEAHQLLAARAEELIKANAKVEELRAQAVVEVARDYAAKVQFLVDWADGHGLLPEHVFTFPDGDTWEARQ